MSERIIKTDCADIYCPNSHTDNIVYIHTAADEGADVYALLKSPKPYLAVIKQTDWNNDLSPWTAEKAFKGGEDFKGHASEHLNYIVSKVMPSVEQAAEVTTPHNFIAGYSLAGLFAVWSFYNTDVFESFESASGSLWYDGFIDYMNTSNICRIPRKAYFSLGDREKLTKSARMSTVEDCTIKAADIMRNHGAETLFEFNVGGHFVDAAERTAKGIDFIMNNLE